MGPGELSLRRLERKDRELLYSWRDQTPGRSTALETSFITYEDHCEWFRERYSDKDTVILILEKGDKPAGQCRFEKNKEGAVVSASIAKEQRGKGLSKVLLGKALEYLRLNRPDMFPVTAYIRPENTRSKRTFISAGFVEAEALHIKGHRCLKFMNYLER